MQHAVNWAQARDMYGQIKKNQLWKKRDVGRVMMIKAREQNNSWKVCFQSGGDRARTHTIKERDIYKFYEKL